MTWHTLRLVLSRASLPMLALAASYGVYQYAALYVPPWVAFVQAAAFESVYIGLAVAPNFDALQRRRASAISGGAVVASVLYNTLAGLFHRQPLATFALPVYGELAFAALHGLPLAWVAYLVADLLLHTTPSTAVSPQSVTVDGGPTPAALPAPHESGMMTTTERVTVAGATKTQRIKALAAERGVSETTAWRWVKEGKVVL